MTTLDAVFTIIGVIVVVVLSAFALLPLVRGTQASPQREDMSWVETERTSERFNLYKQVLEMEFDTQTGKLTETDYRALSAPLLARAAVLLSESTAIVNDADAEIEREIAAARATFAGLRNAELARSTPR